MNDPVHVRLTRVLDFMHHQFPDQRYQVVFRNFPDGTWKFLVTGDQSVSSNSRTHVHYVEVSGPDFDALPELLFVKVRERVQKYIQEAVTKVEERQADLEKARTELDRRLDVDAAYIRLGETLKTKE